ncbi:MAG: phenylalanine--tRNA ligase subunit alpha [Candidatus Magasanikbacteria bacterium CG10_big_fil_rev_8_21_14_0_10_40_10]|uniref:Phenylalanine--tRNA ligase alpha subunit n=1 Tax=Candidatus Magasanikbacteria bacterium CG10_big_fil_rev_8_21_14_0_10_40_10 TaxID=1974648 RepID=A0A2M6W4C5_9BACT|nr:MAG: phenylalanine--tRNA ligase subunit alpha [Candidatus Magasanikbacteria bacterium CG10_big_fil_rev_8_21_14_0_10_40_10]
MQSKLEQLKLEALLAIKSIQDSSALAEIENKIFGRRSGELTGLMKGIKDLSDEAKKTIGALANEVKTNIESALARKKEELSAQEWQENLIKEKIDLSRPVCPPIERGHFHPMTITHQNLEELFTSMGFMVLDGPDLESDYFNFEALNIPPTHPARDSQDTFFIKDHPDWVMRTHTSPVQVRAMQKYGAPLRTVVTGRCFRNEATDGSHEHTFYQMEGLVVDHEISVANLISVMKELLRGVLKKEVEIRLRPGYFPFVEPGFELDMKCLVCQGKGCGACKHSGWVETLPCGLVHPHVIQAGGLDPKEWTGFAFGLGSMRLCMQKYGIDDIRLLHGSDLRFLKQF